jgi:hypothetical protein
MRTAESSKNAQASPEMREILFDLKCNADASLKIPESGFDAKV